LNLVRTGTDDASSNMNKAKRAAGREIEEITYQNQIKKSKKQDMKIIIG